MFGAGGGTSSYKEVEETDLLILWGSNARETHPIFFHHLLKAVHRGAKLYGVDPRRSSSAQWADTWLGFDVGTDIALANTVAREIIHAGLTNDNFIKHATTGFEEYKASVEPWTRRGRLPRALRRQARALRTARPAGPSPRSPAGRSPRASRRTDRRHRALPVTFALRRGT